MDLSIIIVNYNTGELLKNCLDSIFRFVQGNYQVIVYDNASSDGSFQRVQDLYPASLPLHFIRGNENIGFSRANNKAVERSSGRFLHFLNPDVIVNQTLNKEYEEILQEGGEGIWVTSLVDEEGKLLKNKHLIPRLRNLGRRLSGTGDVAYWNIGASVLMNRTVFDRLGGWPEDNFMYAEDLELFYKAYLQKIPVYYLDTRIMHIGKGSTQSRWNERERAKVVEASFFNFFVRHKATWEYFIVRPIMLGYTLLNEPASFGLQLSVYIHRCFNWIK